MNRSIARFRPLGQNSAQALRHTKLRRATWRRFEALEERAMLAAFDPSSILVSTEPSVGQFVIREYSVSGTQLQEFSVPDGTGGSHPATESVRDVVVDQDGDAQIYNGTFDPYLSTLDPALGTYDHHTFTGWSTVSNGSYGGIATLQQYVYATDMRTFGDGGLDEAKGIVRFDTTDFSAQRFADSEEFIDLTLGLDGVLYALTSNDEVHAYDPQSMSSLGSVTLDFLPDHRGVAVDQNGKIYSAAWDGSVYHYDAAGTQLNTLVTGFNNLHDIDIHTDGRLLVGSRSGDVIFTDQSLSTVTSSFTVGTRDVFAAFVDPGTPNEPPVINDQTFSIAENSPNQTLIGAAVASDPESGALDFAIVSGNDNGTYSIDSATGDIRIADNTLLDYELQVQNQFTVEVTDDGLLTDTAIITIDILDVDDVLPVLTANSLTLDEGQSVVLSGSDLAATDVDTDDAALIFTVSNVNGGQFLVSGSPSATFVQSQITAGQVVFVDDDNEIAPSYDISVSDGSQSTGAASATIAFTNVNDNSPVIPSGQQFAISEDASNGTPLGSVFFSDSDVPLDNFSVSIASGNEHGIFFIEPEPSIAPFQVGLIVIDNTNLDFESRSSYTLTIQISDGVHTTAEDITVDVVNVNDVAPVLTANALTLDEDEIVVLDAGDLAATDGDSDDATLTFTVSNLTGGHFEISGVPQTSFQQQQITSGQILFVHDGGETAPSYDISVSDGLLTDGPLAASISFANINDNTPVIPPGQTFSVSEHASHGTLVGTVNFSDADLPGDTFTIYFLSGNEDGAFAIDNAGNITVDDDSQLDFETTSSYVLDIEIVDGVNAGTGSVTVNVIDVVETKFYVVDTSADSTFEYDTSGSLVENYGLGSGNNAPRGAAANVSGTTIWVVDADDHVYVYDTDGNSAGSWKSNDVSRPEGIATDGTDIWIVDRQQDKVFHYVGGAAFASGNHSADSSFSLPSGNKSPKGITTDGTHLWIVNGAKNSDKVFKYTVTGSLIGSWTIDSQNSVPEGITIDPSNVDSIWIVDRGADQIFQYTRGADWDSGSHPADAIYNLGPGNTNPRGIADPPPLVERDLNVIASALVDDPTPTDRDAHNDLSHKRGRIKGAWKSLVDGRKDVIKMLTTDSIFARNVELHDGDWSDYADSDRAHEVDVLDRVLETLVEKRLV